jgi:hypothetical protein
MKITSQRKRNKQGHNSNNFRATMNPLMKRTKTMFGLDDFLSQIMTMKERGDLVISGRRIC